MLGTVFTSLFNVGTCRSYRAEEQRWEYLGNKLKPEHACWESGPAHLDQNSWLLPHYCDHFPPSQSPDQSHTASLCVRGPVLIKNAHNNSKNSNNLLDCTIRQELCFFIIIIIIV